MSLTSHEQSGLEQLVAARLRDAEPDDLLDVADTAIEQATGAGDALTLELIAAELDSAAAAHPERGDGLKVAAARARAGLPPPAPAAPATLEPARSGAEVSTLASWGSRLVAWLIDWVIVIFANALLTYMLDNSAGLLLLLGAFAYFAYFNGQGSTLGKWLLRIKVVDVTTHEPIGTGRGAIRELVRLALTVLTLGVGLVLDGLRPLWNENHQSWHDAAARSIVIHRGLVLIPPPAGVGGEP
jgi:uncharacterized RDD family membrane protein YckC